MEFIKKTELFFIQLQYGLTIEPEPILEAEKGNYSLMLKPDIFFKLINDFQIEYPFIPENKIIELKGLMSKENINTKDALKIIENYKKQYWFLDTVTMFEPVTDKLKRTLKFIDSNISEKEINIELINYQKHLQAKRESIYFDLINEIQSLPSQQNETKTEQETPTFTNNFDNIKPTEIYKHFKAGLVEKGYLTEQELNEYLKAAFELKTKPETLFKLKHTPTKQKIYTVFYVYYKDISQKKHEKQKEYAALLGDFFEGYKTEIIQTNWARDYKTKR
jgi:hypothetical protein